LHGPGAAPYEVSVVCQAPAFWGGFSRPECRGLAHHRHLPGL